MALPSWNFMNFPKVIQNVQTFTHWGCSGSNLTHIQYIEMHFRPSNEGKEKIMGIITLLLNKNNLLQIWEIRTQKPYKVSCCCFSLHQRVSWNLKNIVLDPLINDWLDVCGRETDLWFKIWYTHGLCAGLYCGRYVRVKIGKQRELRELESFCALSDIEHFFYQMLL